MIERFMLSIKKRFSNCPKAKIVIATIAIAVTIITILTVINLRKTLTLSIDGKQQTIVTYKNTVQDILKEENIEIGPKDKLQPTLDSKVYKGESINIKRAVPIIISCNGKEVEIQTAENTIEDMLNYEKDTLKESGIEFNEDIDETSPSLYTNIEENLNVNIIKVEVKNIIQQEDINYDTIIEKDDNLDSNVKVVKTEGINGKKEVSYNVIYKNGMEFSRNVKSSKIISEPQNKIITQGTNTSHPNRGMPTVGKKRILCLATAYSDGLITSSGRRPIRDENGLSTIAVDPTVVPMGSKVYVDGYGYAIASDTGGAIKGNRIDLYFNSYQETSKWGVRKVNLTIVAYPGEY